ncbi:MAG TPA: S41 family peptidase [Gemmatimonadales bacterium]|nr:S41 family peptidase [Gemmatimonadales bacterium]
MARRWILPAMVALVACFTGGWFMQRRLGVGTDVYQQARLFEQVLAHVRDYQVDSLPENELYHRAINGMLEQIRDPYAALLVGKDYQRLQERTTGDYGGIGVQVDARNGWITVVSPMPGTPGERSGIRPGDLLVEVDGISAADWTMERAVQALRGPIGTTLELAIRRAAVDTLVRYRLTRERIHQRAVSEGLLLPDGVGYVALSMVRDNCAAELEQEVARLVDQGMKSLLLDLRSDPGGLRDEAVQAADLFLDRGQDILVSRGRAPGDNHRWSDGAPQRWRGLPVVVLVNVGTASAAEIIAGALQDHDRALVVGDTTYGKGIVQTLFPLGAEVALRITTARWYTPSGRSIQGASLDSVMGAEHGGALATSYRSDGGRRLAGGGGIVPDVQLAADTLTTAEQLFAQALEGQLPAFRDVLTGYALELRAGGAVAAETFTVERGMREEVRRRLAARGIRMADSTYNGGTRILDQQLGYEIARYVFGAAAERRRRVADDGEIGQAVALLRQVETPGALLGLAGPTSGPAH